MLRKEFPILEFDSSPKAMLEPSEVIEPIEIPENCVVCFFSEVIEKLVTSGKAVLIDTRKSELGLHPIYEVEFNQKRLAVFHPGVGAPLAACLLDEIIALGAKKFIACGGAGVVNKDIGYEQVVVPSSAVRDEGTSYHYLEPSREVEASVIGIKAIVGVLSRHGVKYSLGKTWTTDAPYRETLEKVKLRRDEGCLTVEMECAAFFAVAKFRNVEFAQLLYGGDDLSSEDWDGRGWLERPSIRERLFWLAAEACSTL